MARRPRSRDSIPVLIGRRRARDLAFVEQLMLAQRATIRDRNREASEDVTTFAALVRQAIGARECSFDDLCRAIRNTQPTKSILDDELPDEPTPAERPRARALDRLLSRILGRNR
jgi:hypothetical protein